MSSPHLVAACAEALCVAEDASVALYAPQSLVKFRVERFNGARVAGLYVQEAASGQPPLLHVLDVDCTWFVFNLRTTALEYSSTVDFRGAATKRGGRSQPVVLQRCLFHEAEGQLHAVGLGSDGLYECALRRGCVPAGSKLLSMKGEAAAPVLSVARTTGLLALGTKGAKFFQYATFGQRRAAATAAASTTGGGSQLPMQRRALHNVLVHSLACSSIDDCVAVGGSRGELIVFPNVADSHFFSDHWHHTPLEALAFSVDGATLYTGAGESIMLVWSLATFTHRKITCNSGPVHTITAPTPSAGAAPPAVVIASGHSTLVTVDLTQMRVARRADGIEWSAGAAASDLVVDEWAGRPAVMVLGLPNVLRICDPLTQQAVYSLHVSSTAETIPEAPACGIRFAGILHEGRTLVTYEEFGAPALLPLLRFWRHDRRRRTGQQQQQQQHQSLEQNQHVETQTIYEPHESELVALRVDKENNRVFTMSRDALKCWAEVAESATDALRTSGAGWRNQSATRTPSSRVAAMQLSPDGSLCFVSDDSVHVYSVQRCEPGVPWARLATLTQSATTEPLSAAVVFPKSATVAALSGQHLHCWDLTRPGPATHSCCLGTAAAELTAVCRFSASSVLVADAAGTLREVGVADGAVRGAAAVSSLPAGARVRFMQALPDSAGRVAMITDGAGLRVVSVSIREHRTDELRMTGGATTAEVAASAAEAAAKGSAASAAIAAGTLSQYFSAPSSAAAAGVGAAYGAEGSVVAAGLTQAESAHSLQAGRWAKAVMSEPAYTIPRMQNVLSSYLRQVNGLNSTS